MFRKIQLPVKDWKKLKNITQIYHSVSDRGKSAIVKQNPDLITAIECLVVIKALLDLSAPSFIRLDRLLFALKLKYLG